MSTTTNNTITDDLIDLFRTYYRNEVGELAQKYPKDKSSITIDFHDVFRFDPDLADDLRRNPTGTLRYFEDALANYDLPVDVDLSGATVRVENIPPEDTFDVAEVSRHENIGNLLGVRGQVAKVSKVKPRVVKAAFECQRCGTVTHIPQSGSDVQQPHECEGCERQGPYLLDASQSEWTDHQYARVQQPPERTRGGDGVTVDVHLEDELTQEFDAGDRVNIAGVLDIEDPEGDSLDFDTCVDASSVETEESDYEDIEIEKYEDEIRAIANGEHGDPYELLVESVNPQHYGDEDVKLAIALQLFGAWRRGGRNGFRGDSHILMMGDPGCGKSTFLSEVDEIAPRSTYASGKGASASGLTAAAVADDFGDSEWGLEAGALVLADGGVACIDEIDKVPEDAVSSLHDALESQLVRVNKAGMNATLSAQTSMLAAGNPEQGRFDSFQPKAEQLDLAPTLLSRFDLMFMVSDKPDPDEDREVINHMMRSHRASAKKELGEELSEAERESVERAIPVDVFRAYIAYAKERCQPYLHEEQTEVQGYLREEFMELRLANYDQTDEEHPVPVTFRKQEGIERLAEASARVRLDDRVRKEDVDRALTLVKKSMRQVGIDPETGDYDADIVETGQSRTQKQRKQKILQFADEESVKTIDDLVDMLSAPEDKVRHDAEELMKRGQLYRLDGELHVGN